MLLACSDFLLIFAVAREYWVAPFAGLLRLISHLAVMAALAYFFNLKWHWGPEDGPESVPPQQRNDSLILPPAACFLDPQFSTGTLANLTDQQQQIIGGIEYALPASREFCFFVLLGVNTLLTMFVQIGRWLKHRFTNLKSYQKHHPEGSPYTWYIGWGNAFNIYIWACSLAAVISGILTITGARDWMSGSGWIANPDAENDPQQLRAAGSTYDPGGCSHSVVYQVETWDEEIRVGVPEKRCRLAKPKEYVPSFS